MHLRSSLTLAALLSAACTASASLVAWYPLDEAGGTVVNDATGNGSPMQTTTTGWLPTGAFGGSYQLSAGNTLLARTGSNGSLAGINATTGNKVTIMFWLKPNNESMGSSPFWISDSSSSAGNRLFQAHVEWTDGNTYWDSSWGDGSNQRVAGNLCVIADALHHFAFTYNGDTGLTEVFKDGVALISGTTAPQASLPWSSIQNMEFGAASFDSWWGGGQIDDIGIFNEALSPAQINVARTSGVSALAVPEPSTAAIAGLAGLFLIRRRR